MSLCSMPALSAGPSFSTELTSAPWGLGSPKDSASSLVTSWITTAMRPRVTRPVVRSWPAMSMATSMGMAKDRPMNPPVRL